MITWGVTSGSHDGAISVFEGTNLLFASDAERFSKIKNDSDITCVSEYAESEYGVPDKIYFYENPYLKATRRWYARQKPYLKLPQLGRRGVSYTNHHYSHACYGYFTSPYEDCIVISMDAIGEWDSMVIWHASGRKVKRLISWTYPKSLGLMYSAYTQAAGWKPNEEEYIMMGAASVTDHVDSDVVKQIESLWETGFNFHRGVNHPIKNKHDIDDIPAATQAVYERAFCKLLDRVTKMEQYNGRVVFVGGCALNVKANAHLASFFDQVYVPCNPGDGGSAIGSVLARHKKHIDPTPYMGKRIGGKYPVDNIIQELQQQMVVGVANGRAEFGPRSLGNRSLLADPRCKNIKDVVNDCKGRELFRPFAPMILKEDVSEYFSGGFDSPYMSCAWKATDDFSFKYPGVVHYDHTSRLQVVSDGPHRKLLEEWKIATGCPVILNTSLNVKGQPIVNDIGDCLAFTKRTGVLILN